MGNGLFNAPPEITTTLPDIPVTNFADAGQQTAIGMIKGGLWDELIAKLFAAKIPGTDLNLNTLLSIVDNILAIFITLVGKLQGTNTAGFFAELGAIITDLLGVEVTFADMQSAWQRGGRGGGLTRAGAAVYDQLVSLLAPSGGTVSPDSGVASAKAFLGWLMELSVRQGNVALLAEFIPEEFNFLGGLREYGEELAHNLGLGRLARQAFQPLAHTLIATPLQQHLNQQFRPTPLHPAVAIKAYYRQQMALSDVQSNLAQAGYSDVDTQRLINDAAKVFTPRDLLELTRAGIQDVNAVVGQIQLDGWTQDQAGYLWEATVEAAVDPLRKQFLNELTNELRKGEIDLTSATNLLDLIKLLPQENAWYQQIWSQMLSFPRKRLSESQVEKAFLDGVLDMGSVQTYWQQSGYSLTDIQTLTALLLLRLQAGTKTRTGHTGRKHLTEAEIQKALKEGIISLAQAQAYWTGMGYGPVDVEILTALYGGTSPGTPPIVTGTPV